MNIAEQKNSLNNQIKLFSWIGGISAIVALIPLIWAGYQVMQTHSFFKENELGDFIGGTSGTFASFSALAFVYVGFLGQRLQILIQQEELELNRKELQETRKEIEGQKQQLELQNRQFQIQSFETVFFNLIELFEKQSSLVFSENYGDDPLIEQLKKFVSQIRVSIFDARWKDEPVPDRYEIVQNNFDSHFAQGFSRIRTLVGATISVLFHLQRNRELIDHAYYLSLFYNLLNVNEQRLIFYSFFSNELHLRSIQRDVYLEFIRIFYTANLVDEHVKDLLPEY